MKKTLLKENMKLIQGESYLIHYSPTINKMSLLLRSDSDGHHFKDSTSEFILTNNFINSGKIKLELVEVY